MRVGTKRRKIRSVRNLKAQARQRDLRVQRVNLRKSGKAGKMFGEIDQGLLEFATKQARDPESAKTFSAHRRIESVSAEVRPRVHASKGLDEF